jgi:hypothetical protein
MVEFTDVARSGPKPAKTDSTPASRTVAMRNAERRWKTVRRYPYLAFGGMWLMIPVGTFVLSPMGVLAYPVIALMAVGLIFAVVRLNRVHKRAFVEREMAGGMSDGEAVKLYESKYNSD